VVLSGRVLQAGSGQVTQNSFISLTTKQSIMKTQNKYVKSLLVFSVILFFFGCSKDDNSPTPQPKTELAKTVSNVDTDEYEIDQGQLGISISARNLKRKAYEPIKAFITINEGAKAGEYEEEINQDTHLALFSFKNEDLSDSEKNELQSGVAIEIKIENLSEEVLATYTSTKYSFQSNPPDLEVDNPEKEDKNPIALNPEVDYYMQILNIDPTTSDITSVLGAPSATLRTSTTDLSTEVKVRAATDLDYVNDTQQTIPFTKYRFETIDAENNVFNIYNPNGSKKHYLYLDSNNRLNVQSESNLSANGGNIDASTLENYQFQIKKVDLGKYLIIPIKTNIPLIASQNLKSITSQTVAVPSYFRILNFEIEWDIVSVETKFQNPILPPSETLAAYNTALKNCSSGPLSDEVGVVKELTRTDTYSWSESIQVATSIEASLSTTISSTVETSVDCKFFGASNSVTASATAGISVGHSTTETKTETQDVTTSETIQLSSKRTITVPPMRGTTAADIYQEYKDITVPYVQKYRVRGKYNDNTALTNKEIITQFNFNGFSGVVSEEGLDYIEITLKGKTKISHLIATEIVTKDIPDACSN